MDLVCPGTPNNTTGRTSAVESYTPSWTTGGCTAKASEILARGFEFQLLDEDVLSNDTITGPLTATGATQEWFTAGAVSFGASGGMTSFRVALQKQ